MVSVIIPTLNEEKFLPNLLASLAAQQNGEFEVIVVDGRSKDNTVSVAKSFAKSIANLQVLVSPRASLPLQRNTGAVHAKGEWLVFVDADSILMPYFMDRIRVFIENHKPKWFTTWCSPDSDITNDSIITLLTNIFWESTMLIKRPVAPGPLTCIRADIFRDVGGYDIEQKFNEDVEFGLRLHQKGINLDFVRETLYVWSMRRIRRENKLKLMNQYVLAMLPVLILKKPFKFMPGYTMGGHPYSQKKKMISLSIIQSYDRKLRKLIKEFF